MQRPRRARELAATIGTVVLVAVALLVTPGVAAAARQPSAVASDCPLPSALPDGATGGQQAIEALGDDGIAAVAARADRAPDELRDELVADPTLRVDRCGMLLYADDFGGDSERTSGAEGVEATPNGPFPYNQTFLLHSRPSATRVIYLDFDGEQIPAGNAWADQWNGGAAFFGVPFDKDGVPGTFSTGERDVIQAVWQRVSEDYRPFNIDVTTQDPGAAAIARSSLTDQYYGYRALISNDTIIGNNCGCAGVAYVDVFNRTYQGQFFPMEDYQPAWTFNDGTLSGHDLAEITSHEVGHTFGLEHDGTSSAGYYQGHGPWGPIMGSSHDRPMTQFSKGEYAGANNRQDDLAIVSTGAPFMVDEAGGTIATAAALADGPLAGAEGTITTRTDKDLYRFHGNGFTTIGVRTADVGANLDIKADLYTAAGVLLASSNPDLVVVDGSTATGTNASMTQTLPDGEYIVDLDGVGFGNAFNTGYNDYGSVGAYQLNIITQVIPPGVPDAPAAPTAVAGDTEATISWVPPGSDGGATIDTYDITPIEAGVPQTPTTVLASPTTTTVTGLTNGVSYTFTVRAHNAVGTGASSPASNAVTPTAVPARFHPLVPGRVLDSRPGGTNIGDYSSPWSAGAGAVRDVQVGGRVGVPVDATAVVLNVTVVNPTAGSFLQLWPTGADQPQFGSSLNFGPGQIVPNAVTVKLGTGGKVRVFNAAGTTDVIIDVAGYYDDAAGGAGFTALTPARVVDSRPGTINVGAHSTPWSSGVNNIRDVQVGGLGGVPANAEAVVLNVTVVNPDAGSFLQLWPTGATQPQFGSSLNFGPGQIVPNQVTVKLGTGGKVRVFNAAGKVDVIIDVSGYYLTGTGKDFYAVVPGRVLDSRSGGTNIGPFSTPWKAGTPEIRDVTVGGLAGVPLDADGVVMNVTVVGPTAVSFLQLWPSGAGQPQFGSSLNYGPGQIVPNAVTVKLGTAGKVRVFNAAGTVDVIADVAGYFA